MTPQRRDVLAILVPTRLRPHTVVPLAQAFADTCTGGNTWLIFCLDGTFDADAYVTAYEHAVTRTYPRIRMRQGPRRRLVGTLNHHAALLADDLEPPTAIGYFGDDHRPSTPGWDTAFTQELRQLRTGIVYGDDGHQGQRLPTAMAMTADIPRALGFVAPPCLTHMYCDNYWRDLGEGADCLTYLPDTHITHHHPAANKGTWDDSYRESNSPDRYAADQAAYDHYRAAGHLDADIKLIRHLRESHT